MLPRTLRRSLGYLFDPVEPAPNAGAVVQAGVVGVELAGECVGVEDEGDRAVARVLTPGAVGEGPVVVTTRRRPTHRGINPSHCAQGDGAVPRSSAQSCRRFVASSPAAAPTFASTCVRRGVPRTSHLWPGSGYSSSPAGSQGQSQAPSSSMWCRFTGLSRGRTPDMSLHAFRDSRSTRTTMAVSLTTRSASRSASAASRARSTAAVNAAVSADNFT